jgi:exo-beta-1,3-glucanase (GH17 family)
MRFSSSFTLLATILATLCLVQGAPLSSDSTAHPGVPPLLRGTATKAVLSPQCTVKTTSSSSSTTHKSTTTKAASTSTTKSSTSTATSLKPVSTSNASSNKSSSCFPAIDFKMPSSVPKSLDGWWCSKYDEYAFLGFSYEISACQSQATLNKEFLDARTRFNSRYIRLYGACDQAGYYDKVVEAAWNAGIGVHALIWFGFDGDNSYIKRQADLFKSLTTNPKAKFVTRGVQFGSEPLFDWALDPNVLAKKVTEAKATLAPYGIHLTVSDLAYGFQSTINDGSMNVLNAVDYVSLHMLPYFSTSATTGGNAWPNNMYDMNQILGYTNSSKKILWTENGWPSSE